MRRLSCPRCQNVVVVQDGQKPVCGGCGFGRKPPAKAKSPLVPVMVSLLVVLALGGAATGIVLWAPWEDQEAGSTASLGDDGDGRVVVVTTQTTRESDAGANEPDGAADTSGDDEPDGAADTSGDDEPADTVGDNGTQPSKNETAAQNDTSEPPSETQTTTYATSCTRIGTRMNFDGHADRTFVFVLLLDGGPDDNITMEARDNNGFGGSKMGPSKCVSGDVEVGLRMIEGEEYYWVPLDWQSCASELSVVINLEGMGQPIPDIKCVD